MNERARAALRTENARLGSSRLRKVTVDSAAPVPGRHRGSRALALALALGLGLGQGAHIGRRAAADATPACRVTSVSIHHGQEMPITVHDGTQFNGRP
jgi:hypothetical protein